MTALLNLSPARVALALLTALTSWLTLRSWGGIGADPGAYLTPLLVVCLVLAAVGLLLRAARVAAPAVVAVQVVVLALLLNHEWAASTSLAGWVPTPSSLRQCVDVLATAAQAAQEWRTPVPAQVTTFPPLLVGAGAALALAVEVLVGSVRKVPLAGLPLIAAFTVPVSLLGEVPVADFAWAALAFALLLAADQAVRLAQWGGPARTHDHPGGPGRVLGDRASEEAVGLPSVMPRAAGIGVVGVVVAVLAPVLLPSGLGLLDGIGSGGNGDGDSGSLQLTNPMLNIQRDLERPEDRPLLEVRTDDPDPRYLRLTVLDEFDGEAWKPSERSIPATNQASNGMPPAPGLRSGTPATRVVSDMVAIDGFDSQWLPLPYPATSVAVEGDWRYDQRTLDVVGYDDTFTRARVASLKVDPTDEELAAAGLPPRSVAADGTALPDDIPAFIGDLAEEVTRGATTDYERIVMLQKWFREDGGFEYSLDTESGSSMEQLELFLGTGPGSREGYCEQFATAMALMARSLDIPARVAVGFLTPDAAGPQRYVYGTRDLHAWPEIYFAGAGWTTFDPTPSDRVRTVPDYSTGQALPTEDPSADASSQPSGATSTPPRELRRDDLIVGSDTPQADAGGGHGVLLSVLGGLLVLAALVVGPMLARRLVRRRRLTAPGSDAVEGAWAEVRATALDLDLDWDDGATLRRQAIALLGPLRGGRTGGDASAGSSGAGGSSGSSGSAAGGADAVRSLESLVVTLERSRFSQWGLADEDARRAVDDAETVRERLLGTAVPRARRRAQWLPASLWRARRVHTTSGLHGTDLDREQMLL